MGHEGLPPKRPQRRVAAPFPVPTGCTPKTHAAEVAAYIVDMTAGLARMAGDARLDMLTYSQLGADGGRSLPADLWRQRPFKLTAAAR